MVTRDAEQMLSLVYFGIGELIQPHRCNILAFNTNISRQIVLHFILLI